MLDLISVLSLVAVLLVLVSLLQPLAARLMLPHSVLLAGLGIALGGVSLLAGHGGLGALEPLGAGLGELNIGAEAILFIFLPILLFESALSIDVKRMSDDIAPILLLAVVAVLICSFVVGFALWSVSAASLVACLLLGAIVATTDPVAVIGIFRDVGAPRRLSILVEGESLFNDAAAIALFVVLLGALATERELMLWEGAWLVVKGFVGGAAIGYAAAHLAILLLRPLRNWHLAEASITLSLAYLVFILANRVLDVSGVVAVVVAGLVVSSSGRSQISRHTWQTLVGLWEQLGFWASSLVFLFASMLVPRFLATVGPQDALFLAVLVVAAFAARAIVLYGLLPVLTAAGLAERVDGAYKMVILWGGLRGAVTLALALAVTENPLLPTDVQRFVAVLATGFVLFTLLVNATTLRPVMRGFGLHRLSPTDRALRDRALAMARASVAERIDGIAHDHRITHDAAEAILGAYRDPGSAEDGDGAAVLGTADQLRLGLITLAGREEELYIGHFAAQTVSRRTTVELVAKAGRLRDAAKVRGRDGYLAAAAETARFRLRYRLANLCHRWLGIEALLARALADRFEALLITRMVLTELVAFTDAKLVPIMGASVCAALHEVLSRRMENCEQALEALRLQYPDYERALEERFLRQAALRLEDAEYHALLAESVISQDIYNDLQRRLRSKWELLAARPALDLGLSTKDLVRRVPMFAHLDEPRLDQIAALLKPRLTVPGEVLVIEGERGDTMFFISSGAVEVRRENSRIRLGRGDFFGELALLTSGRRNATVIAIAYCQLLELSGRDFRRLISANPDLQATIRTVAAQRLGVPQPDPAE